VGHVAVRTLGVFISGGKARAVEDEEVASLVPWEALLVVLAPEVEATAAKGDPAV
jgi:hypothetical protein